MMNELCMIGGYVLRRSDEVISMKENQWNEMVKVGLHLCFEVLDSEEM